MSDWNLLDPDIIEWRAFGPHREDQRRELCELRLTIEPLAAGLAAGRSLDEAHQRLGEMVTIMSQALGQGDSLTFSRADAEFHGVLVQAAGNRMLDHLFAIVTSALQVSGGPAGGCVRPTETAVAQHQRIVEALGSGEPPVAESTMRELLTECVDVVAGGPSGGNADHVVPSPREH